MFAKIRFVVRRKDFPMPKQRTPLVADGSSDMTAIDCLLQDLLDEKPE